jgi:hypothetical protein
LHGNTGLSQKEKCKECDGDNRSCTQILIDSV